MTIATEEWWTGVDIAREMKREKQTVRKYRNRTLALLSPTLTQEEKERVTAADVRANKKLWADPNTVLTHLHLPLPDAILLDKAVWKPKTIRAWLAQTGRTKEDGKVRGPREMRPASAGQHRDTAA